MLQWYIHKRNASYDFITERTLLQVYDIGTQSSRIHFIVGHHQHDFSDGPATNAGSRSGTILLIQAGKGLIQSQCIRRHQ